MRLFALFTKHGGFAEEREWRVVYIKERDVHRKLYGSFGYTLTQRGVEPKLKLNLAQISGCDSKVTALSTMLASIVLGPSQSSQLAQAAIGRMLSIMGYEQLTNRLVVSGIPFRC